MKQYKTISLSYSYSSDDFELLLKYLDPDKYRYNTGYRCWLLIDTEGYIQVFRKLDDGRYYLMSQRDYSLNGFNSRYVRVEFPPLPGCDRNNEEMLHRLVHYAWKGQSTRHNRNLVIDHIDGDVYNNNPSNLRMVTIKENNNNKHDITEAQKEENKAKWLNHTIKVELVFTEDE